MSLPPLETMLQDANDVIYVHDAEGTVLWCNDAVRHVLGYQPDDVVGMRLDALLSPASLQVALDEMALKLEGRQERSAPYEVQARRVDGSWAWLEVSTRVHRSDDGVVIQGIARDVTGRRSIEKSGHVLRDLADRLQAAPDLASGLGIVVKRVREVTGWPYGEAWVPSPEGDALVPSEAFSATEPTRRYRRIAMQGPETRGQGVLGKAWADQQTRWIRDIRDEPGFHGSATAWNVGLRGAVVVPVFDRGDLVAVFRWMQDVPREEDWHWVHLAESVALHFGTVMGRRLAEDRLRQRVLVLQAQMEAAPYAVMVVSEQGEVVTANERLMQMCGVRRHSGTSSGWSQGLLAMVDDPQRFLECARALYEEPADAAGRVSHQGRQYRRRVRRIHDPDELPLGRAVTFEDVTQI